MVKNLIFLKKGRGEVSEKKFDNVVIQVYDGFGYFLGILRSFKGMEL